MRAARKIDIGVNANESMGNVDLHDGEVDHSAPRGGFARGRVVRSPPSSLSKTWVIIKELRGRHVEVANDHPREPQRGHQLRSGVQEPSVSF